MEDKMIHRPDVAFVLSSCDKCSDLWEPFFMLLKRHWTGFDYHVYLCTDSKQFTFNGMDISCPLRMPIGSTWSENLMTLLKQVEEEFIIFMLEDFWLKGHVDTKQMLELEMILRKNSTIGFICMVPQIEVSKENTLSEQYPNLIKYGKKTPYRVTTQAGLWRRDYLLSLLRRHESAWWFEMFGSKRSQRSKYEAYVVQEPVFSYDEGGVLFRGSYVSEYVKPFVEEEGIVLNPDRRIASKAELMAEQKEMTIWGKMSPRFVYHYVLSHF